MAFKPTRSRMSAQEFPNHDGREIWGASVCVGLVPSWISSAALHQTGPVQSQGPPWCAQSGRRGHPSSHLSTPKIKTPRRKSWNMFLFSFSTATQGKEKCKSKNQAKACPSTGKSRSAENISVDINLHFMMFSQCSALHRLLQSPKEALQVHQSLGLYIKMPSL